MSTCDLVISGLAALALFTYGLQSLSREIEENGGERLQNVLSRVIASPLRGYLLGIIATALIQSSSAVSSFAVALVDAGTITFRGSLAVLRGTNVGTTVTAWLVSFKVAGVGAVFVISGMIISLISQRYAVVGRCFFILGLSCSRSTSSATPSSRFGDIPPCSPLLRLPRPPCSAFRVADTAASRLRATAILGAMRRARPG